MAIEGRAGFPAVAPTALKLKADRVASVDGLRGFLAAVVLIHHVVYPFDQGWTLQVANLAVFAFFAISAYVLTRGWDGRFGVFLGRRFIRLWPAYGLCLAAGYFIAGATPVL